MHDMRKKALIESRKTTSRKARNRPDSLAGSVSAKSTPRGGSHNSSRHASAVHSRAGSQYPSDDEGGGGGGGRGGSTLSSSDLARLHRLRLQDTARSRRGRGRRWADNDDASGLGDSDGGYGSGAYGDDGGGGGGGDDDDEYDDDAAASDLLSSEELAGNAEVWRFHFQDVLRVLQDRKRSNQRERTAALAKLGRLLRTIYAGDAVAEALPAILAQLVKSVRASSSGDEERRLALEGLAVTAATVARDADAADVFDAAFAPVKRVVQDADAAEADKAAAVQALGVVVLLGSGIQSTADELLRFLLEIVESDGASVAALDSAAVVAAATRMWTFAASFRIVPLEDGEEDEGDEEEEAEADDADDDDNDGDDEGEVDRARRTQAQDETQDEEADSGSDDNDDNDAADADYFSSQSQRALEAFLDQLESTAVDVQIEAGVAIALLYEASRKYAAVQGRPLPLREDAAALAGRMQAAAQGGGRSIRAVARPVRRQLRESFRSIATSLELGTGPHFATAGLPARPRAAGGGATSVRGAYGTGTGSEEDEETAEDADDAFADAQPHPDDAAAAGVQAYGHRKRLAVADRTMAIDTWATSVRVDLLRAVLGSGLHEHLQHNPRVARLLQATRLRRLPSAAAREQRKQSAKDKAAGRKKARGKKR